MAKHAENIKKVNYGDLTGLAVTLPELIKQRGLLPYIRQNSKFLPSNLSGDVKSAFKGRGMEFEEVREYNFGDDVRDIDWRVTARKQSPYTKVFNEEKDLEITVVLDLSATMIFGTKNELKSVAAAKLAALIGWLAIENKDRFGLLLYDGDESHYYKAQNNLQNLMYIFNAIADKTKDVLYSQHSGNISDVLKILELHLKGRGTVFLLSDFYGVDSEKFKKIAALAKKQKVYCLNIFDVIEEIAPLDGVYAAEYKKQRAILNTTVDAYKTAYEKHFHDNRANLKENCQKFLCKYLEIRTDEPIFKQLSL